MGKPGKWFAIEEMWKKHLKKILRKRSASLPAYFTLEQIPVRSCANQPPCFSVSGTSTPNGLFKTIDGLKSLIGCTKRLHLLLGDSRNYMPPILVPSSAKRIATQTLVIAKLNGRKKFFLRVFVCDVKIHS